MKQVLIQFLKENIENSNNIDFEKLIEKPKTPAHGDFSFPCFLLAKTMQKAPQQIATTLQEELTSKLPKEFEKVTAMGPFLNFKVNSSKITKQILESIQNNKFKDIKSQNPQKILIEYPSPNTNKNLHIGHVRNILLGNTLSNILKFTQNEVIKTSINNDRGIAICKAMMGYQMFHSKDTPQSLNLKPDEFIAKCYVEFEKATKSDDKLIDKAQEMLIKWEANDKQTRDLWKKVLDYVYEGYKETFKNYKIENFDKQYYESQIYDKGKEIVEDAIKNNVKGFKYDKETGAALVDFENETFGKKYLLRANGTTLYMTQDLYLAKLKEQTYKADKYVFIVGKEQKYHFEVLFEILNRLGLGGSEKNYHFAYGYVFNKDGGKFSSRSGNIISADEILNDMIENSKKNLLSKDLTKNLPTEELNSRAKIIGYGALAFTILNINALSDIKFDIQKALSFEGESGPYVQYTYARIKSILRKAKRNDITTKDIKFENYNDTETALIKLLGDYKSKVLEAEQKYKPSAVSNYLIKICQSFNEFYQNNKIIGGDEDKLEQRLLLIESTSKVIKEGLQLLGIEVLEEM